MAEIKVNVDAVDKSIEELRNLYNLCRNDYKKPPTTKGCGKTVNEMELLAKKYCVLNESMQSLLQSTIGFVTNIRASFVSGDQNAAKKISGK